MGRRADPRGWLDIVVGSAFSLLLAGLAIYGAVHLIESVLVPLLIIIGIAIVCLIVVNVFRNRERW